MKVVILCGGQGTRIREASETLPKPMLPIGGKPIVWHIMKGYASFGFDQFVLCLGYRGWVIKEFFLNYAAMTSDLNIRLGPQRAVSILREGEGENWSVTLADTGDETMTAGRLWNVRQYVCDDDLFMLTYGDGVANVNISDLVAFHRAHGKVATVTAVRPPSRFGELQLEGHRVYDVDEKPQTTSSFINGGFFVLSTSRIWAYLSGRPSETFEREPMQKLAADGELVAFAHQGFWQPMDTPREYNILNGLWASGDAPWKTW